MPFLVSILFPRECIPGKEMYHYSITTDDDAIDRHNFPVSIADVLEMSRKKWDDDQKYKICILWSINVYSGAYIYIAGRMSVRLSVIYYGARSSALSSYCYILLLASQLAGVGEVHPSSSDEYY